MLSSTCTSGGELAAVELGNSVRKEGALFSAVFSLSLKPTEAPLKSSQAVVIPQLGTQKVCERTEWNPRNKNSVDDMLPSKRKGFLRGNLPLGSINSPTEPSDWAEMCEGQPWVTLFLSSPAEVGKKNQPLYDTTPITAP